MSKGASQTAKASRSFKKLTQKEFDQLFHLSKIEILNTILERGGVQKRAIKEVKPKPKPRKVPKVMVTMRTLPNGGHWFYLKIQGHRHFTTKLMMDIRPIPSVKDIKANPDWWKSSSNAEQLEIERLSAYSFMQSLDISRVHLGIPNTPSSKMSFYMAIVEAGFDSQLFDALYHEIGEPQMARILNDYFTLSEAEAVERQFGSMKPDTDNLPDEEIAVRAKRLEEYQKSEARKAQCINWKPGESMEWRLRTDKLVMPDMYNLADRFKSRYPEQAKAIKAKQLKGYL
jgi:D-mannonate dehydratase